MNGHNAVKVEIDRRRVPFQLNTVTAGAEGVPKLTSVVFSDMMSLHGQSPCTELVYNGKPGAESQGIVAIQRDRCPIDKWQIGLTDGANAGQ